MKCTSLKCFVIIHVSLSWMSAGIPGLCLVCHLDVCHYIRYQWGFQVRVSMPSNMCLCVCCYPSQQCAMPGKMLPHAVRHMWGRLAISCQHHLRVHHYLLGGAWTLNVINLSPFFTSHCNFLFPVTNKPYFIFGVQSMSRHASFLCFNQETVAADLLF